MNKDKKPIRYWTKDDVEKIARNYKHKSDFAKENPKAYDAAIRRNWMKEFDWFEPKIRKPFDNTSKVYVIYGYFDFKNKVCYIGLSKDIKKRHIGHKLKNHRTGKYDVAMEYFKKNFGDLPIPTIIEEELTAAEAQNREEYFIKFFSDKGFTTLNIAKAGSLGGTYNIWNETTCYEEAKKYDTLSDFFTNSKTAYGIAVKNDWLKNYTWLERLEVFRWTEDTCKEESKKYKTVTEFREGSAGAYAAAKKNNWLKNYTWLEETFRWTEELCYEEAKRYKLRSEFHDKSPGAYKVARVNGWIKDYNWFIESPRTKWTKETCYNEAKKYKTIYDFRNNGSVAYGAAAKHGWLKDYTWLERGRVRKWTEEMCCKESKKYTTRSEFRKGSYHAYEVSRKNKWLNNYTWLKKKKLNK